MSVQLIHNSNVTDYVLVIRQLYVDSVRKKYADYNQVLQDIRSAAIDGLIHVHIDYLHEKAMPYIQMALECQGFSVKRLEGFTTGDADLSIKPCLEISWGKK